MDYDSCYIAKPRLCCRSQIVCSDYTEGQSALPSSCKGPSCSDLQQITYDLHQLPAEALEPLRDSLITLLQTYSGGPRPIRTQICVCLASLAIQMPSWKNVLGTVGSALGSDSNGGDCLLDFLRILPEEVTEGRKVNLTVCSTQSTTYLRRLRTTSWNQIRI